MPRVRRLPYGCPLSARGYCVVGGWHSCRKPRAWSDTAELLHHLARPGLLRYSEVLRPHLVVVENDATNLNIAEYRFVDVPYESVMLFAVCRVCAATILANDDTATVTFRFRSHFGRLAWLFSLPCLSANQHTFAYTGCDRCFRVFCRAAFGSVRVCHVHLIIAPYWFTSVNVAPSPLVCQCCANLVCSSLFRDFDLVSGIVSSTFADSIKLVPL